LTAPGAFAASSATVSPDEAGIRAVLEKLQQALSFDFVFLGDGDPKNVGKEAWLMVKTEQGWRISSIAYSINFPEKG